MAFEIHFIEWVNEKKSKWDHSSGRKIWGTSQRLWLSWLTSWAIHPWTVLLQWHVSLHKCHTERNYVHFLRLECNGNLRVLIQNRQRPKGMIIIIILGIPMWKWVLVSEFEGSTHNTIRKYRELQYFQLFSLKGLREKTIVQICCWIK